MRRIEPQNAFQILLSKHKNLDGFNLSKRSLSRLKSQVLYVHRPCIPEIVTSSLLQLGFVFPEQSMSCLLRPKTIEKAGSLGVGRYDDSCIIIDITSDISGLSSGIS